MEGLYSRTEYTSDLSRSWRCFRQDASDALWLSQGRPACTAFRMVIRPNHLPPRRNRYEPLHLQSIIAEVESFKVPRRRRQDRSSMKEAIHTLTTRCFRHCLSAFHGFTKRNVARATHCNDSAKWGNERKWCGGGGVEAIDPTMSNYLSSIAHEHQNIAVVACGPSTHS